MADPPTRRLQKDPPEGSRETVERELARQGKPGGKEEPREASEGRGADAADQDRQKGG